MELIYLYIKTVYGEKYDLHLNFSQHTHIHYDQKLKKFSVTSKKEKLPKNFFGENIINVSAIIGKNGIGKTTIINRLAFSGKLRSQDNNQYIIIYKDKNHYFIEGNIDDALSRPVGQRFFDKGTINDKFDNTSTVEETEDHEKLIYLKINNQEYCGNRNMFPRNCSKRGNKQAIFDFLASKEFKSSFKIFRKNNLRINFTNYEYTPYLTKSKNKDDLLSYIEKVSPNVFNILSISLVESRYKTFLNQKTSIPLSKKLLKEQFILSTYQIFYQTVLLFIYSSLYEDSYNIPQDYQKIYDDNLKIINSYEPNSNNSDWFQNCSLIDQNLKKILNNDIAHRINIAYSVNSNFVEIYNTFAGFITLLTQFPEDWFQKNNWLHIDIDTLSQNEINNISNLLGKLVNLEDENIGEFSTCLFGDFSSGEEYLLQSFAQLHSQIKNKTNLTYVLLLDEYELHLHPEWARQFLHYLLNFLKTYTKTKFQLILTSHSPYLVSDLPKDNILLLQFNELLNKREISTPSKSFASNYYELLKDNFFLNDTIGEFAKYKINECISQLNQINKRLEKLKINIVEDQQNLAKKIQNLNKQITKAEKIISLIDDEFIQRRLQNMVSTLKNNPLMILNQESQKDLLRKELQEIEERRLALQKKLGINSND